MFMILRRTQGGWASLVTFEPGITTAVKPLTFDTRVEALKFVSRNQLGWGEGYHPSMQVACYEVVEVVQRIYPPGSPLNDPAADLLATPTEPEATDG